MKKAILVCLLISGCVIAASAQYQPNEKEPRIQFNQESHDFGKIPEGTVATATFEFTNPTRQPLRLTKVTSSCNCVKISFTKNAVKNNEKGTLKVTYVAKTKGTFSKNITVNSSNKQTLYLIVRGKVVPKT